MPRPKCWRSARARSPGASSMRRAPTAFPWSATCPWPARSTSSRSATRSPKRSTRQWPRSCAKSGRQRTRLLLDAHLALERVELRFDLGIGRARRGTTFERPELRFELCRGEPRGRAHAEHPIELALRGYRRLDPLDLILEPPQLVERRRAAPSAEPFRASPCACLADLRGERGLACGDFLDLALHALELGLHLKRSAALLGAQCFGAIALRDDPLLLGERLARERLVASREGELRAALPS